MVEAERRPCRPLDILQLSVSAEWVGEGTAGSQETTGRKLLLNNGKLALYMMNCVPHNLL